jgi:uncharacterized protein
VGEPDEDEAAALAARKGQEHEERYLARVRESKPGLVEIARDEPGGVDRTLAAMREAVPAIYQAHLVVDGWQGYPDFLIRCEGPPCPCGSHHYTPWDTKLARTAKPHFLIQLCAYAEMLEMLGGFRPRDMVFVLGQGEERHFSTDKFFYYYRQLKRSFLEFQAGWEVGHVPDPGLDRSWGRWTGSAEKLLTASDHLSQVATITRGQVRRLEEAGITSLTALAECEPPPPRRISSTAFERLRGQARLQRASRDCPRPLWEARPLPPGEPRRGLGRRWSDGDGSSTWKGFPTPRAGWRTCSGL